MQSNNLLKTPVNLLSYIFFSKRIISLLCVVEVLLFIGVCHIQFETNDDLAMNIWSSGSYTGKPEEWLVFSNVYIGYILKFLYLHIHLINWYTWYLIFSFTLGYVAVQTIVSESVKGLKYKITFHLVMLYLLFPALASIQFTKVAALAIVAGLLIIFVNNENNKKQLLLAAGLVTLGSAIRFDVFYLVFALYIPFLILLLLKKKYRNLGVVLVSVLLSLTLNVLDHQKHLDNKEWFKYKENLKYRRYITLADNPDFDWGQIRDVVSLAGWGKADYDLATNFQYDLGIPKFSTDSLKYIYQKAYGKFSWQAPLAYYHKYLAVFSLFLKHLSGKTDILMLMMFLPFLFLKKNWVLFIGLMFFLFWIIFILFVLNAFFQVNIDKDRLLFVFSLSLYLTVLFVAYRSIMEKTNSFDRYIGLYLCVILIIYTVTFNNKIVYRSWSNKAETVDKAQFIEDKSAGLYVSFCSLGDKSIFDVPSSFQKRYFLGGSAGTPYNKEKLLVFSGKKHEGLYGLKNQKIEWFYLMDQKAIWNRTINFYTANFRTVEIEEDTLYFGLKDSLFHQTISVSN